jgi:hypothetical protein
MADAVFAVPEDVQDSQADRVGEQLKKLSMYFVRLAAGLRILHHIQYLECNSTPSYAGVNRSNVTKKNYFNIHRIFKPNSRAIHILPIRLG